MANMRRLEAAGLSAVVWDVLANEKFSASSGDYFWLGEDEPLRDEGGEALLLVRLIPARCVEIFDDDPQLIKEKI